MGTPKKPVKKKPVKKPIKPKRVTPLAGASDVGSLDECLKKHLPAEAQTLLQDFVRLIAVEGDDGYELDEPWATLYASAVAAKYKRDATAVHTQLQNAVASFNALSEAIEIVPLL